MLSCPVRKDSSSFHGGFAWKLFMEDLAGFTATSNKKLVETSALLVVTGAILVVTRSY